MAGWKRTLTMERLKERAASNLRLAEGYAQPVLTERGLEPPTEESLKAGEWLITKASRQIQRANRLLKEPVVEPLPTQQLVQERRLAIPYRTPRQAQRDNARAKQAELRAQRKAVGA